VRLVWILVAIVIVIALARVFTAHPHRSRDQKILIEKAK
jgi:hypothetical protein